MRLLRQLLLAEARSAWEDQSEPKFELSLYVQNQIQGSLIEFEKLHQITHEAAEPGEISSPPDQYPHSKSGWSNLLMFIGSKADLEALIDKYYNNMYFSDHGSRASYKNLIKRSKH